MSTAIPTSVMAMRVSYDNRNRNTYFLRGIARVRPGVSLDRVQELGELAAAEVRQEFSSLRRAAIFTITLSRMQHHLVAEVRPGDSGA